MTDFFSSGTDEIDFDRAASAFPDIDGDGDFLSSPPAPAGAPAQQQHQQHDTNGFSFDDFDSPQVQPQTEVKVTGDDELEKFQSEFPDIQVGLCLVFKFLFASSWMLM